MIANTNLFDHIQDATVYITFGIPNCMQFVFHSETA